MVNSGSSANLLAVSTLCNPARSENLKSGDEVIIPAYVGQLLYGHWFSMV